MPQSLARVLVHLVFSTKNREPFITPAIEAELHPYMASIFRALKSPSLTIDGTSDHIHILFSLGRIITVADLVEEVKTGSSKWIKTKAPEFRNFHWQKGFRMNIASFSNPMDSITTSDTCGIEPHSAPSALPSLC